MSNRSQLELAFDYSGRAVANIISAKRTGLDKQHATLEQLELLRLVRSNLITGLQYAEAMLGERYERK
jgi:hypothetical protein